MEHLWQDRRDLFRNTKQVKTHTQEYHLIRIGVCQTVELAEAWCIRQGVYKNEQEMEEAEFSATRTQPNKEV